MGLHVSTAGTMPADLKMRGMSEYAAAREIGCTLAQHVKHVCTDGHDPQIPRGTHLLPGWDIIQQKQVFRLKRRHTITTRLKIIQYSHPASICTLLLLCHT